VKNSNRNRRFTDTLHQSTTVVGADVAIEGELTGTSNVNLLGSVNGKIEIDGLLWVHEGGRLTGTFVATDLVVEGEVEGEVTVRGRAELRSTCRVDANLTVASLAIAEGGYFEGTILMEGNPGTRSQVSFVERRTNSN
jgi:cytoskeletal protein CcmA (bactofilin family)